MNNQKFLVKIVVFAVIAIILVWSIFDLLNNAQKKVAHVSKVSATPNLQHAVSPDPGIADVIQQANQLNQSGKPDQAVTTLQAYASKVGANPSAEQAQIMVADIRLSQMKYSDAFLALNQAQKLGANDPSYLAGLAKYYESTGNIDQAIANYSKASQLFGQLQTSSALALAQSFSAESAFLTGIVTKIDSATDANTTLNLATSFVAAKQYKSALVAYNKALYLLNTSKSGNDAEFTQIKGQVTAMNQLISQGQ